MDKYKRPKRKAWAVILFIFSMIFVMAAVSVAVVGYNYLENQNFRETFYCVSSLKVNNKIRIVQISDLHNCSFGNNNDKMINRIEKLRPDLIILTGDIVDSKAKSDDAIIKLCASLSKLAPSYFIYGNNEVEKYYDNPLTQESLDKKFVS